MAAVEKRLREELAELQVEINEEKSRIVDLRRGESFGFLGFDFRRVRSLRGVWRAHYTPKLKKRTALLRKLKDVFRRHQSQPVDRVVKLINPVLRGWVNYFAVGHASECFGFVKDWVEKKIRRHMLRARNRQGFGWARWSRGWLYQSQLQLAHDLAQALQGRFGLGRFRPKFVFPVGSLFRLRVSHHLGRATFPAPASSNAACGFPALRSPVCFASRLMGPILPERLSALVEPLGSH